MSVKNSFGCLLLSTTLGSTAGMATDRGTSTWALEQVCCLRSLVGCLVGCCGAAFWVEEVKDMGQGESEMGT